MFVYPVSANVSTCVRCAGSLMTSACQDDPARRWQPCTKVAHLQWLPELPWSSMAANSLSFLPPDTAREETMGKGNRKDSERGGARERLRERETKDYLWGYTGKIWPPPQPRAPPLAPPLPSPQTAKRSVVGRSSEASHESAQPG